MSTTVVSGSAAPLRPVPAPHVRWAAGFWRDVQDRTRRTTVPNMWHDLCNDAVSPAWRNFRIAAGEASGEHEGPPFLDGDYYKWLEAAISQLEVGAEPWLEEAIDGSIRVIASCQRDDGYVHTATIIAARNGHDAAALADRFAFETYNLGHLITAAVRHFAVTGRTDFLNVAERAAGFLEHLATDKPDELARSAICPSHYMAVIDLYRATRDERYLRLAEAFVRVRDDFRGGDDNQDRLPVREQTVAAGHAVRANYLFAGLADLVAETGDAELRVVLERLWTDVADTKLYITGGCGALYDGASPDGYPWQGEISRVHQAYGRPYQLPNTTAHNETCANIGMILWSERMLALCGDARYADLIERIAYNSLLSGVSLDGSAFCYTNPLRQVRDLPYHLRMPGDTGQRPVPEPPPSDERLRQRYLSCFCCPPNVARTLSQFHERAMSAGEAGVWVHLYGGIDAAITLPDGRGVRLSERSDYPWQGRIEITVAEASGGPLALHLRVPGWVQDARLTVNEEDLRAPEPGSYARVEREWRAGDVIVLDLPMPVRVLRGHRLAEEVTGQVAVVRGPIVYALESSDLPAGVRVEQVALRRGVSLHAAEGEVAGHRVIEVGADAAVLPPSPDTLYGDLADDELGTVRVRLIPYFSWGNRGPSEMTVWMPLVWCAQ